MSETADFEASLADEFSSRGLTDQLARDDEDEAPVAQEEPVADIDDGRVAETDDRSPRERDEQGRFVAQEPVRPEWLPDKFSSAEEMARSYTELEQRLGQSSQEMGDLRRHVEYLSAAEQRRQQAPGEWEDLIDEDPVHAANEARRLGNAQAYSAAIMAMNDAQPGWGTDVHQRMQEREYNAFLQQQQQQSLAPVQEEYARRELAQAINQTAGDKADFDQLAPQMNELLMQDPYALAIIRSSFERTGSVEPAVVASVIDSLYWKARGRNSDNLVSATQEAAQAASEEARARKLGATVASTSAAPGTPAGDAVSRFTDSIIDAANGL